MMSVYCVIASEAEAKALLPWAALFAKARSASLTVCFATQEQARSTERVENALQLDKDPTAPGLELVRKLLLELQFETPCTLIRLKTPDRVSDILEDLREAKPGLLLLGRYEGKGPEREDAQMTRTLFEQAPSAAMLIRPGPPPPECGLNILLPASGGANAVQGFRLAKDLTNEGATGTPLYIAPQVSKDEAEGLGRKILKRISAKAGIDADAEAFEPKVIRSDKVTEAIHEVASEGYDLMIFGQSEEGQSRRNLFSNLHEKLYHDNPQSSIAVVRTAHPLREQWSNRFREWIRTRVPQLSREERIDLFERLQEGSRWSFDFIFLISMSTAIAALGLINNSAAVVIGAMLVAPLMLPILSAGLGLVQGNLPMMKSCAKSIIFGFLLAMGIGALSGAFAWLLDVGPQLTPELTGRGAPNLLDVGIALFSGIAAAYCFGRTSLSAALPGVAIAAALVPPIATVGISLVYGAWNNALGASILFLTNVVIIILGAAITFWMCGIRRREDKSKTFYEVLFGFFVLIAVLLGVLLYFSRHRG